MVIEVQRKLRRWHGVDTWLPNISSVIDNELGGWATWINKSRRLVASFDQSKKYIGIWGTDWEVSKIVWENQHEGFWDNVSNELESKRYHVVKGARLTTQLREVHQRHCVVQSVGKIFQTELMNHGTRNIRWALMRIRVPEQREKGALIEGDKKETSVD